MRFILSALASIFALWAVGAHPAFATSADGATTAQPVLDIDAMAARMKNYQETYRQIRDDSLAAFAKAHPNLPSDEETKTLMGIAAYLWVWGDFYGEGLWQKATALAEHVQVKALPEWQANMILQEARLQNSHSSNEEDAQYISFAVTNELGTDYPFELKMQACAAALGNFEAYKTQSNADPNAASFKAVPFLVKAWGENYRKMLKGKFTHDQLYQAAAGLLCETQNDEHMLDLSIAEIDEDFNEVDPANPVKIALDGDYYVDAAWCARGSDWASNVTDTGWKLFAERLAKADAILEAGFAKYPAEGEMACSMINVELGQGQGRDRMELWFQRAIKDNPDDYCAYKCKEWYLQPRWYGSEDDIMGFGAECLKTGNWAAKLPMIWPTGIAEISDQDPGIYSRAEVWQPLEKIYREYLSRYPQSIDYRTNFAKHAYDGGHKDVATEQFKILGGNWDRSVVGESEHADIMTALGLK